ncbi:hypothetical protein AAE478_009794 [Parahypoxylon ruwenzoriense]
MVPTSAFVTNAPITGIGSTYHHSGYAIDSRIFMWAAGLALLPMGRVQALYTKDIAYGGWVSCTIANVTSIWWVLREVQRQCFILDHHFLDLRTAAFMRTCASLTLQTLNSGIAFKMIGQAPVDAAETRASALAPFCKPVEIGFPSSLLVLIRSLRSSIAVAVYSTPSDSLASTVPANAGLAAENVPALVAVIIVNKLAGFPGLIFETQAAVVSFMPTVYSQTLKTLYLAR